ncbi:phosphatase PAP2 family protein [Rhizobium sp. MC63]|uniref:Phosphatase PAP2 family protein n=1 Tax=Rhizobium mulingense TaxID=3031128 RepID=A0ACC6MSD9_9HYPH|nr:MULTISPECIES: phosphatase PAP2 family protein [unclassified Rhizobium]MDF0696634.1 phosphatase PAP2 family protein [Rhizobium sp. MC63]MEA3516298.1 phosphatase PAP2 family protein [Rhizobium sp. MJ31]MEB3047701.1 phosphatase PAP2 family protein [Rhizobium sp. MJ21]
MLNSLDTFVIKLMGQYSSKSIISNKLIIRFLDLNTVKFLPLFILLWFLWFFRNKWKPVVVECVIDMFFGIGLSRLIQLFLPERLRPLHSGNPDFVLPLGVDPKTLEHWSSFPSDHAALTFAVSTTMWRASRPLGAACFIWSTFVICLPRIYAGYHYATDILGGAFVGVCAALLVARPLQKLLMPHVLTVEERFPGLFFSGFFVISYEFVTQFDELRLVGRAIQHLIS